MYKLHKFCVRVSYMPQLLSSVLHLELRDYLFGRVQWSYYAMQLS